MNRLRHGDELVGALVVLAALLFIGAIVHAGLLRDWFKPTVTLQIILPEAGVGGLVAGADVELLGTHAGTVRRIVINPNQQMYAEAEIDEQAKPFIRRDTRGLIRRRFGIAGAAFLELSRGTGAPIDWNYAVVQAATERDPTEDVGALVDQVREKVFPMLDDLGHASHSLAVVMERVEHGEGDVGRLVSDDRMMREVEGMLAGATRIVGQLESAARDVSALTQTARGGNDSVPVLLRRADRILAELEGTTRELTTAAQQLPQIARNVEGGTKNLPSLLTQVELTARELDRLLEQLRGSWLIGGGAPAPEPKRVPATQVRP